MAPRTYSLEPVCAKGKGVCALGPELLPRGSAMGVSEYSGPHTHPDSVYKVLTGPELSMFNV